MKLAALENLGLVLATEERQSGFRWERQTKEKGIWKIGVRQLMPIRIKFVRLFLKRFVVEDSTPRNSVGAMMLEFNDSGDSPFFIPCVAGVGFEPTTFRL